MSELRIPTVALDAEVLCADGRAFRGRVFVPPASPHHDGPMRVTEWMNDRHPFFPFRPADGDAFIMNKDEVVVLTVEGDADSVPEAIEGSPRRAVEVECRDKVFRGEVAIDMPPGFQRLTDHLNRPDTFLIVEDGARRHLVRKSRITRVVEP
jgi:hypothetical protein